MNLSELVKDKKLLIGIVISAVLGYLATIVIPNGIHNVEFEIITPTKIWILCQVLVGMFLGALYTDKWILMCVSTTIFIFLHAVIDVAMNFHSRTLWPIEIIFSFVTILPAMAGAYISVLYKRYLGYFGSE